MARQTGCSCATPRAGLPELAGNATRCDSGGLFDCALTKRIRESANPRRTFPRRRALVDARPGNVCYALLRLHLRPAGPMCVTARTTSLWTCRVYRLNPDSLMNILFPSDCSMDSAWVRWRGYPRWRPPFLGVAGAAPAASLIKSAARSIPTAQAAFSPGG